MKPHFIKLANWSLRTIDAIKAWDIRVEETEAK